MIRELSLSIASINLLAAPSISTHFEPSLLISEYFEKCHEIAPTESSPLSMQEYEKSYILLEKEIISPESFNSESAIVRYETKYKNISFSDGSKLQVEYTMSPSFFNIVL